jgi:hypothetical protein
MKRLIYALFLILPFSINAQSGYYINKDKRINKTKDEIISYLIEKKVLPVTKKNLSAYYSRIYINKEFEFASSCNNAMFFKFGTIADHSQEYWGVIFSRNNKETLYILKSSETAESLSTQISNCDTARSKAILYYIQCVKKESPWIDLNIE